MDKEDRENLKLFCEINDVDELDDDYISTIVVNMTQFSKLCPKYDTNKESIPMNFICESLNCTHMGTTTEDSIQHPFTHKETISTVEKQIIHTTDIPGQSRTLVPRAKKDKKIFTLSLNYQIKEIEKNLVSLDRDVGSTYDPKMLSIVRKTRQDIQIALSSLKERLEREKLGRFRSDVKKQNSEKLILVTKHKKAAESFVDYRLHRSK
jgi:hypothetical protein